MHRSPAPCRAKAERPSQMVNFLGVAGQEIREPWVLTFCTVQEVSPRLPPFIVSLHRLAKLVEDIRWFLAKSAGWDIDRSHAVLYEELHRRSTLHGDVVELAVRNTPRSYFIFPKRPHESVPRPDVQVLCAARPNRRELKRLRFVDVHLHSVPRHVLRQRIDGLLRSAA